MADNNDNLIRELKSEMERERFEKLWKKYSVFVFAAAGLIVATVGGYQYWKSSKLQSAQAAGAKYEAALDLVAEKKLEEANSAFAKLAQEGPAGYAALSQLQLAGSLAEAGKRKEAVQAYEELTKRSGADLLLKNFARLQVASLRLDEADFTEMKNRLTPLAEDSSSWRFSARELLGLAAMKAGKDDEARQAFEALLGDRGTPPAMQERVQLLMAMIIAGDIAAEAKASDATAPADGAGGAGDTGAAQKDAGDAASGETSQAASKPAEAVSGETQTDPGKSAQPGAAGQSGGPGQSGASN